MTALTSVSIVIPTFNRAGLLARAVDSALAQTTPCEVIVCDHGSSDSTPTVAARYGNRIRYIRRDTDNGPIACWRDGIEQASGRTIHINYDDDWIEPSFVSRCLELLRDDVGFVYTQTRVFNPITCTSTLTLQHPAGIRPMSLITKYLLRSPLTISPGCALFRRHDVLKNLLPEVPGATGTYGKRSGVGEDLLLFLLTSLQYPRYAYVAEPLAVFMAHPASITTDAMAGEKRAAFYAAYATAKAHYLSHPGSMAMPTRIERLIDEVQWHVSAGGIASRLLRVMGLKQHI
jgi:glycosyltransferase involved in cell wall biosynthesis